MSLSLIGELLDVSNVDFVPNDRGATVGSRLLFISESGEARRGFSGAVGVISECWVVALFGTGLLDSDAWGCVRDGDASRL